MMVDRVIFDRNFLFTVNIQGVWLALMSSFNHSLLIGFYSLHFSEVIIQKENQTHLDGFSQLLFVENMDRQK